MAAKASRPEVLLAVVPWELPQPFLDAVAKIGNNIEVLHYICGRHDTWMPPEIPQQAWDRATVLLTWNGIPSKEQASNVEYIQLLSAGCNHFQGTPVFEETDVSFCTANGVHPPQMAEWVISTYLAFQHHLYQHWDNQKMEKWVVPESDEDTEDAGILGYGAIGRQCARLGQAVGMDVHAFTLHEKPTPESRRDDSYSEPGLGDSSGSIPSRWFHGQDQLNDFLAGLDLLVITLPLTSLTRGMIAREQFEIMGKRRTFVSNVGRGQIVNTDDLVSALNEGTIKGAALDVTDPEPLPPGHPLWKAKNVAITPHDSGNSKQYNERVLRILLENLKRRAEGRGLMNRVNRSLGY